MAPLLLLPGLVGASLLLLVAGAGHLRRREELARLVVAHRVLPVPAAGPVARSLPRLELVVGIAGLVTSAAAVVAVPQLLLRVVAGTACTVMVVLACYQVVQRQVAPDQACGCFDDAGPASLARLVGHVLLAAWAGAPLLAGQAPPWPAPGVVAALVAGVVAALVVRHSGGARRAERTPGPSVTAG